MENSLIVVLGILAAVFLIVVVIKKRKKKSHFRNCKKDPSGVRIYHDKIKIKFREPHGAVLNKKDIISKIAVLEFKGDIKATGRIDFSNLVDEVVLNAEKFEEVVVKVESPGGGVSEYGFLYAELLRLRALENQFKTTVCIDTVAASGGYLMSIPAHKILAAPFAMVGSIGVVSFVPNIREFLEDKKIKPRTFTAGNYKRTVTLTDDATPEEIQQYEGQLKLIHDQFKHALKSYRPNVDLDKVATGEAWLASTSQDLDLGLVDKLILSSTYLLEKNQEKALLYYSRDEEKKPWWKRLSKKTSILDFLLPN